MSRFSIVTGTPEQRQTVDSSGFSDVDEYDSPGERSRVYHESSIDPRNGVHDGRSRNVSINDHFVSGSESPLVDVIEFGPGVSSPEHYHENTAHSFFVLEGEGVIEIDDTPIEVEAGTVAWIGEGDRHRVYCREGESFRVLEYSSNPDYDTVYTGGPACTWTAGG